jgi:hypothetical protein
MVLIVMDVIATSIKNVDPTSVPLITPVNPLVQSHWPMALTMTVVSVLSTQNVYQTTV